MLLFSYSNEKLQAFAAFIESERALYPGNKNNLVAFALEAIFKRYRSAWRLKELADPLIDLHIAEATYRMENSRSGPMSAVELRSIADGMVRANEIQMLFESLFMHGSIMCDELAHLLLYFFGDERGVKLGGHRQLSKNFRSYAAGKKLVYPESLPQHAISLESDLCDFRDKQIVHDFNPRKTRGLGWSLSTKDMNLSASGYMYPKPTDAYVRSKGWNELIGRLDIYVWEVLEVVQKNRSRSRLRDP